VPVHLLAGPDEVSIDDAVRDLIAGAAIPVGMEPANLTRFDAATFTFDAFRFACDAVPFLADGRVVTCRGVIAALGARHDRSTPRRAAQARLSDRVEPESGPARRNRKALATDALGPKRPDEVLAEYVPLVPASTLVIFVEAEMPSSTSALGKIFAARGVTVRPFPMPEGDAMIRWLRERARRAAGPEGAAGGAMTVDAARTLAAHVGSDVRLAATEVRKLVTYAGPGRAVEARDVEMLTPQAPTTTKVWEFTQAILEGQRERAVVRLGQLIDGADFRPEQVIASVRSAVAQHLTVLAMSLAGDDDGKVGRQLRMQPFAVKMTRERATRLGDRVLMYMHRQVLEADLSLKTGRATPRLAAELLVVELAARAVQAMQMRSSRRA
jgi:DNA polymerase III delta subunit